MILSAGSNVFNEILKQTIHPNPFIYLKGTNRVELEYILDFLYNGEAYVAHEELNKFLETAQDFQVKGLQQQQFEESEKNQGLEQSDFEMESKYTDLSTSLITPTENIEERSNTFNNKNVALVNSGEDNSLIAGKLDLNFQIEEMIEKNGGVWHCKQCK